MNLKRIVKLWYFRIKYFKHKVTIQSGCDIALKSTFEGCNVIGRNSKFAGKLGFGSYIAENTAILGRVGRYCSIASDVRVLNGTHPLTDFVSSSPVFYSLQKQSNITFVEEQQFEEFLFADKEKKHTVIIGNDVWIGNSAIIVGGIVIGDGAVILANATVTKDIPPYSIVGGVPAKIVRKRFDDETIEFLIKFKWWDRSVEWLRENANSFQKIEQFKSKFYTQ